MNSPSRDNTNNTNFGYKTIRPYTSVQSTNISTRFTPIESQYKDVNEYNCVIVLPEHNSTFYRMDKRLPFKPPSSKASTVFGTDRNTYFGVEGQELKRQYNMHTHLYTIKPNSRIVLIDMGKLENVVKLKESASDNIKISIDKAFPIVGTIVKRTSEASTEHHDRNVLNYICTLPDIDGYYVDAPGHHAEIGFCKGSLHKVDVVGMTGSVNPPKLNPGKRGRPTSEENTHTHTRKNGNNPNNQSPSKFSRSLFGNKTPSSPPSISRRGPLSFGNLEGGKRKHRKTTQKKRKTQRKK
jgi:hypothetical protein